MSLNFSWIEKKDGDSIFAEHVNDLADGIKESQKSLRSFGDIPAFVTEANETSMIARRVATDVSALADEVEHISSELNNKPEKSDIPTKVSELENDAEYVTKETLTETTLIAGEAFTKAEEAKQIAISNTVNKADKSELPQKVSELENDAEYVTGNYVSDTTKALYDFIMLDVDSLGEDKANKTKITTTGNASYTFDFSDKYNTEMRMTSPSAISITFKDDEYEPDYISGLSFNCGETPTAFDYTDSGIINWVGTDTSAFTYKVNPAGDTATISLFIPSPNTHYDIVFYYNGNQFIGLVNGFVPASGNEAV